jgi:small Trp-rich protein
LIGLNLADIGPFGAWNWNFFGDMWRFLVPFALAIVWWIWSDATGWTKRKAMVADEKRKRDRLDRNIDAMGLGHLHKHRDGKTRPK